MPIRPELRHFYRGPAWEATRARIRERAGDRCEACSRTNGTYYVGARRQRVKVQCGACHKNGISGDDRDENLAWWCRACHLAHDRGQHRDSRAARKDRSRPILEAFLVAPEGIYSLDGEHARKVS
jgi:hypothetical protein